MMLLENTEASRRYRLQRQLLVISFCNLLLVSLLGVLLRSFPFLSSFPLTYQHLLHGHSHFAFGGWVMPVLLALVLKNFSELSEQITFQHWRNIAVLTLLSAYGMLASFPVQGYAAVSIGFSTLSIAATVYFAWVVWKAAGKLPSTTALRFLKWGLLYACLSAIGPFATGPLVAMGKSGSPIYFDAIYFYLHFQYNGFFSFVVLALLYRLLEKKGVAVNGRYVFWLFNLACVPTYALSVLWSEPPLVFNVLGGAGALLQLAGFGYLLIDVSKSKIAKQSTLLQLSLTALLLKLVLQAFSALPFVSQMAYQHRNFVIAYLHLVLLGFISLFVFANVQTQTSWSRVGISAFLFSFVTTEVLLVLNAAAGLLHFDVPYFIQLLFFCSLFFPVGIACMLPGLRTEKESIPENAVQPVIAV